MALLLLLCVLARPAAQAQRKRDREEPALAPAPPPPVARDIAVRPGEMVVVPLGIHGSRAAQLEFLVRSLPKSGKVSKVKPTGLNTAAVQYTAGPQPGNDRFAYAVRSADGVSAPVWVNITIIAAPQLPVRLFAAESVDFPTVIVGEESTAKLEVKNQGGGVAEGELTVPVGWRVEGSNRYSIAAGKSAEFKLVFAPQSAGEFSNSAILGPTPRREVNLHGKATPVLQVTPARLQLTVAPGQIREGFLKIDNLSAKQQTVMLSAGPRVMVETSVIVPAFASAKAAISVAATNPTPLEDKIELVSSTWTAAVPVHAEPIVTMVKFAGPGPVFQDAMVGRDAEATVVLENSGGVPAIVSVRVDPPFELSAAGVEVPAGGQAKVPVLLRAPKAGSYTGTLTVELGGAIERMPLAAVVGGAADAGKPSPPLPAGPAQTSRPTLPDRASLKGATTDLLPSSSADLPGAMGDRTRDVTSQSAVLEWAATLGSSNALAVQERQIALGPKGAITQTWTPLAAAFSEAGGKRRAELRDLQPGRIYVVRVTAAGTSLFTTKFFTPEKKPMFDIGWKEVVIAILVLALGGYAWWRWKTRVRSGW